MGGYSCRPPSLYNMRERLGLDKSNAGGRC